MWESTNKNPCPVWEKCGGCQLQNLSYEDQLAYKQKKEKNLLSEFGKIEKIIPMENPEHYRNKVQAAFACDGRNRIISGVYQSGSHRIVKIDKCMTEDRKADKIIADIRNLLPKFKLTAYDERKNRGMLRHVLVKRGFATNQIMVVLVTATPIFPSKNNFAKALVKLHPEITTVIQNVNPGFTSLVLGKQENVLFGKGYIEDILCGCKFRISSRSFYQINPVQTEILYNKAIEYASLTGSETVLDAYCGIGTIGLVAAKNAGRVIGVELNPDAVRDAIVNCKLNGIKNARFYKGDAGEFMSEIAAQGDNEDKPDVVFMDPPRAGSSEEFLNSLLSLKPQRVVYVSCNPETLARDLTILTSDGYEVKKIQPVDMFPHTNHIETVCLLTI